MINLLDHVQGLEYLGQVQRVSGVHNEFIFNVKTMKIKIT